MGSRPSVEPLRHADVLACEREYCRRSLAHFVECAWSVTEPGNAYIHGWHIDAVCEHLEAVTAGEINRLLINIPPGTMKSTLVNVFWPAWEWGPREWASMRYIGASHEQGLAIRDSRRMRMLVQSDWYQSLWPIGMAGDQNEKLYYENTKTGFRQACAVGGMTGRRGDRVVWDDPHNVEASFSVAKRETAIRVMRETVPSRMTDPSKSAIVVVMQRLHEKDVAGYLLDSGQDYTHLMLPMEFEPDRRCVTSLGFADPRKQDGELLFPERFPRDVVERDKLAMGPDAVAGQNQQRPTAREGGQFKPDKIETVAAIPSGMRMVRGWDLAGTEGGGDYLAGAKIGVHDGIVYIADMVHERKSPERVESILVQTGKLDGCRQSIPQDPGQAGKAQVAWLSRKMQGVDFRFSTESGSKEVRAEPFAAQVNAGNVRMVKAGWNEALIHELRSFPRGAHDDMVDALSRAYNEIISTPDHKSRFAAMAE